MLQPEDGDVQVPSHDPQTEDDNTSSPNGHDMQLFPFNSKSGRDMQQSLHGAHTSMSYIESKM
ncbi:hypothetical protein KFK09_020079 [Dendrobium nobile]|uniref:Uncharacterized protein n=1 Tax=Dendrobium nobile TaxID=94219 RepID=A0A8T3AST4_DENNO|nr:hypothetical protein KFK09_020079 [Dendrobium nobile]